MSFVRMSGYDRVLIELRSMAEKLAVAVREHFAKAIATLETTVIVQDWRI